MFRFLKEPLLQFFAGGVLLYAASQVFLTDADKADEHTIVVSDRVLIDYYQYRNKAFDLEAAVAAIAAMDADARARLTEDYIRDEVLVREALALGLDANDEVIRRRLIQKMEFVVGGFEPEDAAISEADLDAYFKAHREAYHIAPSISFTHVFLDAEKRGTAGARAAAVDLMAKLNESHVPFEDAGQYGDHFFFHRNYIERTPDFVASHFGTAMTESLFAAGADEGKWIGPFASEYGQHLVLIRALMPGRDAELSEVAPMVLDDMRRDLADEARAEAVGRLRAKYRVVRDGS